MIRDLGLYENFMAVVEQPSITAAAKLLRRSVQAVSRDLARLEADLGVTLIARTTRSRQLTAAGGTLYDRLKPLLSNFELACEEARAAAAAVRGPLRIAGPTLFGPRVLTPIIAEFLMRYAEVTVSLDLTDAFVEPTVSGADVTVRIGDSPVSGAIARRLGEIRRVVVAAPSYLATHGRPLRPADLAGHSCIVRRGAHDAIRWAFRVDGGDEFVAVRGRFETDNVDAANEAVARGLGIGVTAYWQVRDLIDQGRMELLLTNYEPQPRPIQAIWAHSSRLPARTRLFIEFLAGRLGAQRF
jgi:DNA-binding transcriptional LysR family regulator